MAEIRENCKYQSDECLGRDCYYCSNYIDNIIYNNTIDNYSSVLRNSVQSTESVIEIMDGMTEIEVHDAVEAILKNEFEIGLSDNQRIAIERKVARFFVRAVRGAACGRAKGLRFRWFTCTESDEAIDAGLDSRKIFNKFFTMLRYSCPDFQYIVIEHRQGDCWRRNWHVLSYGSDFLPLDKMDAWWKEHFQSMITGMQEVRSMGKAIKYVAGYLSEPEKYVRSSLSQGWVFPGWLRFSKECHKEYGIWFSQGELVKLALMAAGKRKLVIECYIGERK